MGKLHVGGISEPVIMSDEKLESAVTEILQKGYEGKSTILSAYTNSGATVIRVTPETSFMAKFDEIDLEEFLGIDGGGE